MWWPFKRKSKVGSVCGELLVRDRDESHAFDVVPNLLWGNSGYRLKREFVENMATRAATQVGKMRGVPITVRVHRNEAYTQAFGAWTVEFCCGGYVKIQSHMDEIDMRNFEVRSLHPLVRIGEYVDQWVCRNIDGMKSQQNMEKHVEAAASIQRINNFAERGV